MLNCTEPLNLKLPREMADAIRVAEKKTGANRSEIAREAIRSGLKEAVARRIERTKEDRAMLAVAG